MQLNKDQIRANMILEISKAVESAIIGTPAAHQAKDREVITKMMHSVLGIDGAEESSGAHSAKKHPGKFL